MNFVLFLDLSQMESYWFCVHNSGVAEEWEKCPT